MKKQRKTTGRGLAPKAYRHAFESLNTTLEANTPCSNAEKIRILGLQMFGANFLDDPAEPVLLTPKGKEEA